MRSGAAWGALSALLTLRLAGIPTNNHLFGFFQGCKAPAQLDHILAHGIFDDPLFFSPQNHPLGRCTIGRPNMKIDVARSSPVLFEDTFYILEHKGLLISFAKAKHHYQDPDN